MDPMLEKTLLTPERFDSAAYEQLLEDSETELMARPIELIPNEDRPIDELVDEAYQRNEFAQRMIACLRVPECRKW